jgi:hypothetical protein
VPVPQLRMKSKEYSCRRDSADLVHLALTACLTELNFLGIAALNGSFCELACVG